MNNMRIGGCNCQEVGPTTNHWFCPTHGNCTRGITPEMGFPTGTMKMFIVNLQKENAELQNRLSTVEKEKKELTEKYSCCGGKTSCANNQLRCFCDEIFALYEKDKDEAKERLGVIIETLETDRDWAKCARKETHERLSALLKVSEGMKAALEKIKSKTTVYQSDGHTCQQRIDNDACHQIARAALKGAKNGE